MRTLPSFAGDFQQTAQQIPAPCCRSGRRSSDGPDRLAVPRSIAWFRCVSLCMGQFEPLHGKPEDSPASRPSRLACAALLQPMPPGGPVQHSSTYSSFLISIVSTKPGKRRFSWAQGSSLASSQVRKLLQMSRTSRPDSGRRSCPGKPHGPRSGCPTSFDLDCQFRNVGPSRFCHESDEQPPSRGPGRPEQRFDFRPGNGMMIVTPMFSSVW